MTLRAHAVLGASSSHRWMECPGSIKLSEGLENIQTVFAREGSAAHAVAEKCLELDKNAEEFVGQLVEGYDATEEFEAIHVDDDMADAIQVYLDTVRAEIEKFEEPEIYIESRFDLSHIYPGMFGTNDCLVYCPRSKKLVVFDYKHGQGIAVEVERNPQLMYYALGALTGKHNRPIDEIELVIVQPRCPHKRGPVRRWSTTVDDMLDFIAELQSAAKNTEDPDAEFHAGDWCKFCPAAGICQTLEGYVYEIIRADFTKDGEIIVSDPNKISPKRLAHILSNGKVIDNFLKSVRQIAHKEALAGRTIPGFRLVQSKPRRVWRNEEVVIEDLLDMGLSTKQLYHPKKLKTPAQVEAYLGKKAKKTIEHLWVSQSKGISLVQEGDPRPDLNVGIEEEFGI